MSASDTDDTAATGEPDWLARVGALRAAVVRLKLHLRGASMWPGQANDEWSNNWNWPADYSHAAVAYLQLCRECAGFRLEVQGASTCATFEYVEAKLRAALVELSDELLDDATASAVLQDVHEATCDRIERALAADWGAYQEAAYAKAELAWERECDSAAPLIGRAWGPSGEQIVVPPAAPEPFTDDELAAPHFGTLSPQLARAIDLCVEHLDEILAHGPRRLPSDGPRADPNPLAVRFAPPWMPGQPTPLLVSVLGTPKPLKTKMQAALVAALVNAGGHPVQRKPLTKLHKKVSQVLNELCRTDPDWRHALQLARGNGGYRIRTYSEALAERQREARAAASGT